MLTLEALHVGHNIKAQEESALLVHELMNYSLQSFLSLNPKIAHFGLKEKN